MGSAAPPEVERPNRSRRRPAWRPPASRQAGAAVELGDHPVPHREQLAQAAPESLVPASGELGKRNPLLLDPGEVAEVEDPRPVHLGQHQGVVGGRAQQVPLEDLGGRPDAALHRLLPFRAVHRRPIRRHGEDRVVLTVATDGAAMYGSERQKAMQRGVGTPAEIFERHLLGAATDHALVLSEMDRARIFNLGYFTWVEQQGVSLSEFTARRDQAFWRGLRELLPVWDGMIAEFNGRTGL